MQQCLRSAAKLPSLRIDLPAIDWAKYGFVCFSHRAAIVMMLRYPLTAPEIKRRARRRWPSIPMSTNNVRRDALLLLEQAAVVRRQPLTGSRRVLFRLTDECRPFPQLLENAQWRGAFD